MNEKVLIITILGFLGIFDFFDPLTFSSVPIASSNAGMTSVHLVESQ